MTKTQSYSLDITGDVCPMTFVRSKLLMERIAPGDVAVIRLKGQEPVENVPRSLAELGHQIISFMPENVACQNTAYILTIRKKF